MAQGWEAPDGSRSVVFALGIPSAIRARVLEAFHSLPKRGAEIGGLLVGRILHTKPLLARITGFEEIPCQHRFGPSYILAEEDLAQLDAALKRERADPVIGFARSYTGREMVLDEADRNLLDRYFPGDNQIFLLLQPRSHAACLATFLFPENGEIGWEPQAAPFDFVEARLGAPVEPPPAATPVAPIVESQAAPEVPPALEAEPERAPVAVAAAETDTPPAAQGLRITPAFASFDSPAEPDPEERRAPKRRLLLPLAAWIAVSLAAAGIYELWTLASAPRWAPLHLNAQLAPGTIHLGWDRNLREVRDAERGVLAVEDGGGSKRIALSQDQIRAGRYDYKTAASDVLFRLEVSGAGIQGAGDSLKIMASPVNTAAAPPKAQARPLEAANEREADRETAEVKPTNVAVLPEPLREIHPDIPAGIRARIQDRVVVPVEVKVTAGGRVTSAEAHGGGSDGLYHYLADRAAQAARQWRFSPARSRNGKSVPATRTVYFVFTRPQGG